MDPTRPPRMRLSERYPWTGRYWGYSNRPFRGCGCLYPVLLCLLSWWLLSLVFPTLAIWNAGLIWIGVPW